MALSEDKKAMKFSHRYGLFHSFELVQDPTQGIRRIRDLCSVDIIIPYHERYDLVRRAVLSIVKYTKSNPYLITLVDDGSQGSASLEFINLMKQAPQTVCLKMDEQLGFGAAIQYGLQHTSQPYICVMHSDCEVQHMSWLEKMGEALILGKKNNIRMVVPTTNNPVECELPDIKTELSNFDNNLKDKPPLIVATESLPMHCFMCHRELFSKIGMVKSYPYKGYEDEELFYRMQYYKYKQAIATHSWIYHEGSATVQHILKHHNDPKLVIQEMKNNRGRCVEELKCLFNSKKTVFDG